MPYKNPEIKKAKQKTYARTYYEKNKRAVISKNAVRKRSMNQRWLAFKAKQKCYHCGAKHPAIIDFHHVIRDKTKRSVNNLINTKYNYRAAMEEIKKCIPLCANCHRILHWKEKTVAKRRATIRRRRLKAKKKATG